MTDKLPPPLLALFQPRPPLRYLPPSDRAPDDCQKSTISGVAQFLADAKTFTDEVPYNATESWVQRKLREKTEKKEQLEKQIAEGLQNFNPDKDPQARGDPFRTLFVGRLNYEAKEADLEREFGRFGPIERITIVKDTVSDKKKKPHRGYAFVVFEREKDMRAAYKETESLRIKGRLAVVDVERGRTTKGWKPRRLGGGLGGRGYTKLSAAPRGGPGGFNAPSGPGGYGGFRGGYGGRGGGGGFRGGGFRGGGDRFGGPRGGIGYQGNRGGFGGQAPPNAPSGPGGGRSGGFRGGSFGGDRGGDRGGGAGGAGGRFDRGATGSNSEPVRPRDSYADRDRRDYDRDDRYRDRDRDRMGDRGMGDRNGDRFRDRDRERGDRYGGGGRDGGRDAGRDAGRDGGREDYGRKRTREDEPGHDDPRSRRRY
ncbi:hypothetical protein LT330_010636 [Penicillium expansum]|uniref:RRM domain-containing protein n=1 Tax=Penicillium expansum TaxID=27334 RepID=A0A0A2KPC9_PENEN|nr:hypothetical protein PEX2_033590 [Penicillium expansum]KAK4863054.1 hypothetical protein LT330_010636 [Penicillium expansum]KGO60220.1 hypothetical protein PEX2_033590 [Penicillium expansum]KGO68746.1 hypothetical protein PEX1_034680 [Penicillium expansum]